MSDYGLNLTQEATEESWHPREGSEIQMAWRGTPLAIAVEKLILRRAGVAYRHEVNPEGGKERLVAITGSDETQPEHEPITDEWSLEGNDLQKDIWTHPKVTAIFADLLDGSGFPTDQYVAVRQDIDAVLSGQKKLSEIPWWSGASVNTKKLMRALLRGETGYEVSQFVLKRTQIVAKNYSVKPDYARVNRILTHDQLVQAFPLPDIIKFALPSGLWMEKTPSVVPKGDSTDNWKLTFEFWNFQEYDDFLYDPVS